MQVEGNSGASEASKSLVNAVEVICRYLAKLLQKASDIETSESNMK